jgi:hypothetical protein
MAITCLFCNNDVTTNMHAFKDKEGVLGDILD